MRVSQQQPALQSQQEQRGSREDDTSVCQDELAQSQAEGKGGQLAFGLQTLREAGEGVVCKTTASDAGFEHVIRDP